jgi:hypothetical protein
MTTALVTNGNGALAIDDKALLALVTEGDCGKLTEAQKLSYYRARCDAAGLDYRAQPFQFVKLNSKLVLYALKACSEQLAAKHGLSVRLVETPADVQELAASGGCRAFTARVTGKDGRETDDVGVVTIKSASGDTLANAIMKGATKAKRRAVLAHCGLGMLDETEIETIPRAQPVKMTITDHDGEPTTDQTLEQTLRASVKKGAATPLAAETAGLAVTASTGVLATSRPDDPASPVSEHPEDVCAAEMKASEIVDRCLDGFRHHAHWHNSKVRYEAKDRPSLPPEWQAKCDEAYAESEPKE